jgi:hypothetical protein
MTEYTGIYQMTSDRQRVEKENMIEGVSKDAIKLRTVLSKFKNELKLPFLHGFPHNCCEIVSHLFAELIHDKYPESDIRIVEARNYIKAECHFWVTVNGYVYDLTSDQFDSFNGPILGVKENPLSEQFNFINSITFQKAVNGFNIVSKEDHFEVIHLLKTHLTRIRKPLPGTFRQGDFGSIFLSETPSRGVEITVFRKFQKVMRYFPLQPVFLQD